MGKLIYFLRKRKYELLLFALLQHLFIGIFLQDLPFYTKVIWPINMVILGIFSIGIFAEKAARKNILRTLFFILTILLPVAIPYATQIPHFVGVISIAYSVFFVFIFLDIIKFLIKPSYINIDIISASACGYLLLIEISVFLLQSFFYYNPASFKGIDTTNTATTYIDFVYFCSITFTSIGFGDITPSAHYTKLATSLMGIAGQFYSVVLVGILISKFSSKNDSNQASS